MLYKVTPMLPQPEKQKPAKAKDPNAPKEPRKRRKSAVYDADGNEVLITMMCLKCRSMKPLAMFGLRKMADGAIRNQPWCRTCRSGAGTSKKKGEQAEHVEEAAETAVVTAQTVETPALAAPTESAEHEPADAHAELPEPAP